MWEFPFECGLVACCALRDGCALGLCALPCGSVANRTPALFIPWRSLALGRGHEADAQRVREPPWLSQWGPWEAAHYLLGRSSTLEMNRIPRGLSLSCPPAEGHHVPIPVCPPPQTQSCRFSGIWSWAARWLLLSSWEEAPRSVSEREGGGGEKDRGTSES